MPRGALTSLGADSPTRSGHIARLLFGPTRESIPSISHFPHASYFGRHLLAGCNILAWTVTDIEGSRGKPMKT
jgi:hypothetical protein